MLSRRCADEALAAHRNADDRWFDVLRVAAEPVGYCNCALAAEEGVLKLEQFNVAGPHRGRGFVMDDHVMTKRP